MKKMFYPIYKKDLYIKKSPSIVSFDLIDHSIICIKSSNYFPPLGRQIFFLGEKIREFFFGKNFYFLGRKLIKRNNLKYKINTINEIPNYSPPLGETNFFWGGENNYESIFFLAKIFIIWVGKNN